MAEPLSRTQKIGAVCAVIIAGLVIMSVLFVRHRAEVNRAKIQPAVPAAGGQRQ